MTIAVELQVRDKADLLAVSLSAEVTGLNEMDTTGINNECPASDQVSNNSNRKSRWGRFFRFKRSLVRGDKETFAPVTKQEDVPKPRTYTPRYAARDARRSIPLHERADNLGFIPQSRAQYSTMSREDLQQRRRTLDDTRLSSIAHPLAYELGKISIHPNLHRVGERPKGKPRAASMVHAPTLAMIRESTETEPAQSIFDWQFANDRARGKPGPSKQAVWQSVKVAGEDELGGLETTIDRQAPEQTPTFARSTEEVTSASPPEGKASSASVSSQFNRTEIRHASLKQAYSDPVMEGNSDKVSYHETGGQAQPVYTPGLDLPSSLSSASEKTSMLSHSLTDSSERSQIMSRYDAMTSTQRRPYFSHQLAADLRAGKSRRPETGQVSSLSAYGPPGSATSTVTPSEHAVKDPAKCKSFLRPTIGGATDRCAAVADAQVTPSITPDTSYTDFSRSSFQLSEASRTVPSTPAAPTPTRTMSVVDLDSLPEGFQCIDPFEEDGRREGSDESAVEANKQTEDSLALRKPDRSAAAVEEGGHGSLRPKIIYVGPAYREDVSKTVV